MVVGPCAMGQSWENDCMTACLDLQIDPYRLISLYKSFILPLESKTVRFQVYQLSSIISKSYPKDSRITKILHAKPETT